MTVAASLQPAPAPEATAASRLLSVVFVLLVVVAAGLWLGRRALRAAGVRTEKRAKSAAEREEAFMAMTVALHEARRRGGGPPEPAAAPAAPARAAAPERPAFAGQVYCPACGAALGATGHMLRFVTRCPGCGRRLSARAEGARVAVDVDMEG